MQYLPRGKVYTQKEGDLCHIASRWHGQREKDLYVTLCGKVVSTLPDSPRTDNVGYHVDKVGICTCAKCRIHLGQKMLMNPTTERETFLKPHEPSSRGESGAEDEI